jgi:hypothetical protein
MAPCARFGQRQPLAAAGQSIPKNSTFSVRSIMEQPGSIVNNFPVLTFVKDNLS